MTTVATNKPDIDNPGVFTIGTKVRCSDGTCGKLTRVIIDPLQRTLTHIVVEPRLDPTRGRLVPLDLVEVSNHEEIRLSCSMSEFDRLSASEESDYFPMDSQYGPYYGGYAQGYGYGYGHAAFWPYYGYGGMGYGYGWDARSLTYDAVPPGEVDIRRGDPVHATDGEIGRIAGLVIGTPTGRVSHVLLQEGHLLGKRDVSIPIGSVTRVGGVVQVNLSKRDLENLPSIDIDHPESAPDLRAS